MLKYPCLVLDHDDTVVQSEATVNYPFFVEFLREYRPGMTSIRQGCESEMGCPHAPAGGPLSPVLAGRALLYHHRPARSLYRRLASGIWRSVPFALPDNRNGITDHALRRVTAASSPQMNAPAGKGAPAMQESGQTHTPRQHRSPSFPHGFLRRKALH